MPDKILVTGASGNVGRVIVKELRRLNQSVVAAALNEANAGNVPPAGAEVAFFDFGNPATYPAAFAGVNKLFLMRPPAIADVEKYLFPVIDYALAGGVKQIVFLSLLGVNRRTPHYRVEKYLKDHDAPYTFIRPGFYMQNLDTTYRDDIRLHDEIYIPAGRGKTSFIDVRDIGAVAAKVLTEDGHLSRAYEITGPEALSYYRVAEILTETLGRPIVYRKPSPEAYKQRLREQGTPEEFVKVQGMLYWPIRWGFGGKVTSEVSRLLGRPPIAMQGYARDYAEKWRR